MDVTPFHRGLLMLSLPEEAVKEGGEFPGFSTQQAKSTGSCSQQQSTIERQRTKASFLNECVVSGETTPIGCEDDISSCLQSHLATEQDLHEISTSRGSICSSVPSFADSDWSAASSQLLETEPLQFSGYDLLRVGTPKKESFSFREEWLKGAREPGCSTPPIYQTRIQDLRKSHRREPKRVKRLPPRKLAPKRKAWYCWVDHCSDSGTSFETFEKRLQHYECNHADMLLQCRIPGCLSQKFVREADRAKHMTIVHSEEGLETILRSYEKPELNEEKGERGGICKSGSFPVMPEHGETIAMDTSLKKPEIAEQNQSVNGAISETNSASDDPSDAFSTDSSWSDEYDDCADIINPAPDTGQRGAGISLVLTPVKSALVETLMKEFWEVINHDWSFLRKRGEGSPDSNQSSSATTSSNEAAPKRQSIGDNGKRARSNEDGERPEERDGRNPKRRKGAVSTPDESVRVMFACPYRKHAPRRYSHNNQHSHHNRCWKTCALTGYQDISRIKTHLYRTHRIFQCRRCKELFANSEELDAHGLEAKACSLKQSEPEEGITDTIEKKLRNRKKAHRNQSEAERWQEIYQVLFPEEEPPDPYFEPPQDEIVSSPDVAELSNYEEFSRRELPRIFRSTLEEAVTNEVEEQLRTRLIDIIQECQDRVFSMYRGSRGISTPSFHSDTRDLSHESGTQNSERPEPVLLQESENGPSARNAANVGTTTIDSPFEAIDTTIGSNSGNGENSPVPISQPGTSEQILVKHTPRKNPSNDFAQTNDLFKSAENSGQYEESENTETRQMLGQQVADHYPDISFEEVSNMDFFSSGAEIGSIGGLDLGYWRTEGITAQYGE